MTLFSNVVTSKEELCDSNFREKMLFAQKEKRKKRKIKNSTHFLPIIIQKKYVIFLQFS